MVQLNLLPDVKLQYIKAKRNKRFVMLLSALVVAVSVGLFVIMFGFVFGVQKHRSDSLEKDIKNGISTIQKTPEIDKILTVQNQLQVINAKHEEKPATARILPYIAQTLPAGAKLTSLNADFTTGIINLSGTTSDINSSNKLVDTLKFAEYRTKKDNPNDEQTGRAFSEVVLSSYSTEAGKSNFTISMKFDPILFKNTETVELNIPGIVSTRSSTEKPNIEFIDKNQNSGGQ